MTKYKARSMSLSPVANVHIDERTTGSGKFAGNIGASEIVSTALERYAAILDAARRNLAERLTDAEVAAILDACNGTMFVDPASIRLVWANVLDSVPDGIEAKWQISAETLAAKLRALGYAESVALVDAIERWWRRVGDGDTPTLTVEEVFRS